MGEVEHVLDEEESICWNCLSSSAGNEEDNEIEDEDEDEDENEDDE
jgi:hypothetical protein